MTARILVVDDIPANVRLLEARLSAEYFEVLSASDGPTALSLCAQGLCDVVLMDVMMPEMDGYEATRRIRDNTAFEDLPIIAITAKAMKGDREKCISAGASDYVTKPVDSDQLISLLRVWLSK